MSDEITSEMLDAIHNKRHGIETHGDGLTPEQRAEAARNAETDALNRLPNRKAQRAAGERLALVHRALQNEVGVLAHGRTYDAHERREMVDAIVRRLGGNVSDATRGKLAAFVKDACEAIAHGDKMYGTRKASEVAEDIANGSDRVAAPSKSAPGSDVDDNDPAALAALVPRA